MKWINKSFIFYIIIISFCQCAESPLKNKDRIRIFYPLAVLDVIVPITDCDMILNFPNITDTIINDKEFFSSLDSIISLLKPSKHPTDYIDFRMKCVIRYSNQTEKVICLGEKKGVVCDGIRMQDNDEIFNKINNVIYNSNKKTRYIDDPYDYPKIDYNKEW